MDAIIDRGPQSQKREPAVKRVPHTIWRGPHRMPKHSLSNSTVWYSIALIALTSPGLAVRFPLERPVLQPTEIKGNRTFSRGRVLNTRVCSRPSVYSLTCSRYP